MSMKKAIKLSLGKSARVNSLDSGRRLTTQDLGFPLTTDLWIPYDSEVEF